MLEQVIEWALAGSNASLATITADQRFAKLVAEGEQIVQALRSDSFDSRFLPYRLGIHKFACLMNSQGVREAWNAARRGEVNGGLADGWARERALIISFGKFVRAVAKERVPKQLVDVSHRLQSQGTGIDYVVEMLRGNVYDALHTLAKAAPKCKVRDGVRWPMESFLPWLYADEEGRLKNSPTCLGFAILLCGLVQHMELEHMLVSVHRAATTAYSSAQYKFCQEAQRLLNGLELSVSPAMQRYLNCPFDGIDEVWSNHLALTVHIGDGTWTLEDPYQGVMAFDEEGRLSVASPVLCEYGQSGLTWRLLNDKADRFAAQAEQEFLALLAIVEKTGRFVRDTPDPRSVFLRFPVCCPFEEYAGSDRSGLCAVKPDSLLKDAAVRALEFVLNNQKTRAKVSATVRRIASLLIEQRGEDGKAVVRNPLLIEFGRAFMEDRRALEEFRRAIPGLVLSRAIKRVVETVQEQMGDFHHPEMEILDPDFGFGIITLTNVARCHDRVGEFLSVLARHTTWFEAYLQCRALHSSGELGGDLGWFREVTDRVLGELPTAHPDALLC